MKNETKSNGWSWMVVNVLRVVGALGLLLVLPLASWAGGVVTSCTESALRVAMAGGGTVTFACDGTITLANTISNDFDITLDGTGHQVAISGGSQVRIFRNNANVSFTVIHLTIANGSSGGGSGIMNLGGTVNLTGVTFRSNTAIFWGAPDVLSWPPTTPLTAGGAILNRSGTLNATNCSFTGNTAQAGTSPPGTASSFGLLPVFGGAIWNAAGQVNLQSCIFVGNQVLGVSGYHSDPGCGACGGAIYNGGTMSLGLCILNSNSVAGGSGGMPLYNYDAAGLGGEGSGGAIFNTGTLTIDRTTFSTNAATGGGGGSGAPGGMPYGGYDGGSGANGGAAYGAAICNQGTLTMTCSTLASNVVRGGDGGSGGNCYVGSHNANGGSGRDAGSGRGGAVFNGRVASLVNCTIAANTGSGGAGGRGGAGWNGAPYGQPPTARGGNGGNGGTGFGGVDGTCNLVNCTVAWNVGYAGSGGAGGTCSPADYSGGSGTSGAAYGGTMCGALPNTLIASNTPAGGDTFTDPKLGPLTNNGGPTLTIGLLPGSPAMDAGNTSLSPVVDQRGFPRPAGLAADIGAFEYGSVMPTVAVSQPGTNGLNILASGNAGQMCRLLSSPDMLSWVPMATNQIGTNGTTLFYDSYVPGGVCRFYRISMP